MKLFFILSIQLFIIFSLILNKYYVDFSEELRDEEKKRLCTNSELLEGKWRQAKQDIPLEVDLKLPKLLGYKCPSRKVFKQDGFCAHKNEREHLRQLKSLSWYWEPLNCDLIHFDADSVLSSIKNRKIMLIGDHLTEQWYYELICLVGYHISHDNKFTLKQCEEWQNKGKPDGAYFTYRTSKYKCDVLKNILPDHESRILFQRNDVLYLDYLTFSSPVLMPKDTVYFKKLWKELLGGRPSASDILILSPYNFLAVDEMHYDMFVEVLATFLKEHFMGTVIFRTPLVNFHDCHLYSQPLTWTEFDTNSNNNEEYWRKINRESNTFVRIFREHEVNLRVMNVSMFELMTVGHRLFMSEKDNRCCDCYLFCAPAGPIRIFNQLLAQIIQVEIDNQAIYGD